MPNPTLYRVVERGGTSLSKHLMYSDVEHNNNKVGMNEAKFYIIQLLENAKPSQSVWSYLFTRWGRVGEDGSKNLRVRSL